MPYKGTSSNQNDIHKAIKRDRIKVPISWRFVLKYSCRDSRGCSDSRGCRDIKIKCFVSRLLYIFLYRSCHVSRLQREREDKRQPRYTTAAIYNSRDTKIFVFIFILRLSCFAAAGKHYFEPISRLPQGAAAGRNQVAATPQYTREFAFMKFIFL